MNQADIETLAIGDEVGVGYNSYRDTGPKIIKIGKVEKINGHGHIKVVFESGSPLTFTKKGNELGQTQFRGHYLIEAERAHENNRERVKQQKVNMACRQVTQYLVGQENGYHDFKIDAKGKAFLLSLVEKIPVDGEG